MCVLVAVVWVGRGFEQGLEGWGGVMSVCGVGLDSLCI